MYLFLNLLTLNLLLQNAPCPAAREDEKNAIAEAIKELKDKDPDVRTRALRTLQQNVPGDQASIATLVDLLNDPVWDTRVNATDILGRIGPAALPALCQALGDKRKRVREAALWAMGDMGAEARGEVSRLLHVLEKDAEEDVRLAVVGALGQIGGKEAINALIRSLKEDRDKSVRCSAAFRLGHQEDAAQVLPPLVETLAIKQEDTDDASIVDGAVFSLSSFGFSAVHPLLEAVKDPNFGGKEYAIRALGEIFRELRQDQRLTGDPLPGDIKVALPELIESAKDPKKETRLATMEALEEMEEDGKGALTVVKSSLKDSSPLVRIAAARAFYHIGGDLKLSVPVFMEAMKNPDPDARRWAIAELEQLGEWSAPVVPQLIDSLSDPETQTEAMNALGRVGLSARRAVPKLIELMKDKNNDEWLRHAAISTLGEIGPAAKEAVPLLREIADKSKDAMLREAANSALEAITR